MKLTSTVLGVFVGAFAISNAAANPVVNVINVQTDDPAGYTEYLAKNPVQGDEKIAIVFHSRLICAL